MAQASLTVQMRGRKKLASVHTIRTTPSLPGSCCYSALEDMSHVQMGLVFQTEAETCLIFSNGH